MRRLKAILIIATGVFGFVIMPTENLLQAVIGVTMFAASVWMARRNWRAIYRELILMNRWIDRNLFKIDEKHFKL
jgi:hypothetical protein